MRKIELTQGQFAVIDDDDYDRISSHKWYAKKNNVKCKVVYYAATNITILGKRTTIRMHQFILGSSPNGKEIDHADGNTLNNQKHNLRFCTRTQNLYNAIGSPYSATKHKGITFNNKSNMYRVRISINGKSTHIGCFKKIEDAICVYNNAALKYHGEFARLNVISHV